jgi:Zn-finger nucleic acid-binding protein
MDCPKCDSIMEPVTFNGITVDRCTKCVGIWFSEAEHKILKGMKGSEAIDTGSPAVGRQYDEIENVACPTCGQDMDRVADSFQPHIHYEVCSRGHGVFFDAGEYKDFKEETIGDFFKSLAMRMKKK